MLTFAALVSLIHPLLFCTTVLLIALSFLGEGHGIVSTVLTAILILAGPLGASCTAAILQKWCLPSKSVTSIATLAGFIALYGLLRDDTFLTAVVYIWMSPGPSVSTHLLLLGQTTAFVCLSASLTMISVLLVEVPLRWCTASLGSWEADGLARVGRWILTATCLSSTWYLVVELAQTRLGNVLNGLIR